MKPNYFLSHHRQMKTYVAPEWSQVDKELAKLELEQKKREAKLAGIEYREEEEDDDDDTDEEGNDSTQDGQDEDANNIKQNENDDDFDDKDENELFCVACDKSFKSSKSFQNHEKSKKHKENIELLKKHMKEEDMSYLALNETQDKSNDATNDNQTTRTNKYNMMFYKKFILLFKCYLKFINLNKISCANL